MAAPFEAEPELERTPDDLTADHPDMKLFARIEGLIGEEIALLKIPAKERSADQRDRLHAIGDELDRIFASLRERAERLAGRAASGDAAG
jgi:hypothetical protein